uniref:uncharacterized protein LOC109960307 n=1 Tax=Monopterus albus TaxID=43700 RepID=UPI0009B43777|nr:uncharacterized protein LOC109960307 [Monopterus albus]
MRKTKHRTETKGGKGAHHSGTKKKEKPPSSQSVHVKGVVTLSKPLVKRSQKTGKKPGGNNRKEVSKKSHSSTGTMSPPMRPHYMDVAYRSDRRPYYGKSSTLLTLENTTRGHCTDMAILPGGATPSHTHHPRWSNPGEISPAWAAIQHTCRRSLTEYCVYSHDFSTPSGKEWDRKLQQTTVQDNILKCDCKPQILPKVPRSITAVALLESNVRFLLMFIILKCLVIPGIRCWIYTLTLCCNSSVLNFCLIFT